MKKYRGFTLMELIIAVAILAILMGIAAPSLRDLMMNATVTSQANDLMSAFAVARSEAIKRGVRTGVCTSTNGTSCTNSQWHEGWIVFLDSDANGAVDGGTAPLKVQPATDGQNTLTSVNHGTNGAGARFIGYSPAGSLVGTLLTVTYTLCDYRTTANVGANAAANKGRTITVTPTGRPQVLRSTCA
jgi:type IV fimbrial biogenesis protein FimT